VVGAIVSTSLLVGAGAVLATHLVGGRDGANAVSPAVYQSAVAAYEQRRWDEAEARFRAVLAARPEDTEAARYLQLVQAGRAHEQTITAARAVLTGGDARGALAQVAAIPAQSPLAADAEAVRQAARDHIVRSLVEEARAAGAAGQGALAQAKLAEASSFDPTSVLVAQARAELGGVVHPGLIATAPASGTRNTPGPTAPALGGATRGAGNVGGGGTGSGGTAGSRGNAQALADRAMAAYRSGDYATAASTMRQATQAAPRTDQRRYEAQAQKLERLARDLPRAQSATATPQILQAVIEIDESIEGGGSVARTLKPRLAAMLVDAANRSWATGDVAGACGKARQALAADGTNRAARDLDSRCIAKVGELLSQAQRAERTSRQQAVGLYRQVTQIAPPGSPPHVQATERLGALEGSGFAATRGGPSAAGPTRSTGPTPTGPTPTGPMRTTGPTPTGPTPTGPMRTTGPTPTGPTPAGSTGPTKVRRPVILDEDE
jgi:tetratricopeptide (TPR) repeat protein